MSWPFLVFVTSNLAKFRAKLFSVLDIIQGRIQTIQNIKTIKLDHLNTESHINFKAANRS